MTPEDMGKILSALAEQIPTYTAIARAIVDERLNSLKDELLNTFADSTKANAEAFKDPDFQYLVNRAQQAYARSGDQVTRDTLVDLIARRSKENKRGRLALTLDDAVEKAAMLTPNEFAELSMVYLLKYTAHNGLGDLGQFFEYCRKNIDPLLPEISRENASYQYIAGQGCGSVEIMATQFIQIFRQQYAGLFSGGFDQAAFNAQLPTFNFEILAATGIVIPCLNNRSLFQLAALNLEVLKEKGKVLGMSQVEAQNLWNFFLPSVKDGDELLGAIERGYPNVRTAKSLWDETPMHQLSLTTVGIAIGHANLVRVSGWGADLAIWIK